MKLRHIIFYMIAIDFLSHVYRVIEHKIFIDLEAVRNGNLKLLNYWTAILRNLLDLFANCKLDKEILIITIQITSTQWC